MLNVCSLVLKSVLFFFFKQKTAYEMRISDWSSDVCSSDLWFAFEERLDYLAASLFRFIPQTERQELLQGMYERALAGDVVDLTYHSSPSAFSFEQVAAEQSRQTTRWAGPLPFPFPPHRLLCHNTTAQRRVRHGRFSP